MIASGQNIFIAITPEKEKELLENLRRGGPALVGQASDGNLILVHAVKVMKKDEGLIFRYKGQKQLNRSQKVTFSFLDGSDKYLFQSEVEVKEGALLVKKVSDFFRLQRRSDYRLRLPEDYQAVIEFVGVNGVRPKTRFRIDDVSANGAGAFVNEDDKVIVRGLRFNAILRFPRRPPLEVEGEVRHREKNRVGLCFDRMTPETDKRLRAVVMELYRELFSQLSRHMR